MAIAVDLDDESSIGPGEVRLAIAVVAVDHWPRETVVDTQLQEERFEVAPRPRLAVPREVRQHRAQRRGSPPAAVAPEQGLHRPEVEEAEIDGAFDRSPELMGRNHRGEVHEGPRPPRSRRCSSTCRSRRRVAGPTHRPRCGG